MQRAFMRELKEEAQVDMNRCVALQDADENKLMIEDILAIGPEAMPKAVHQKKKRNKDKLHGVETMSMNSLSVFLKENSEKGDNADKEEASNADVMMKENENKKDGEIVKTDITDV